MFQKNININHAMLTFKVSIDAKKVLEFYAALDNKRFSDHVVRGLCRDAAGVAAAVAGC